MVIICVLGYIVLRALTITGGITFVDKEAGTDFRLSTLTRLYNSSIGRIRVLRSQDQVIVVTAASILAFVAWPFVVGVLWNASTNDAYAAKAYSEHLFDTLPREQEIAQNDYIEVLRQIERAADADTEMYMAFMERDAFVLAISLSFNYVFLAVIALFTWSELLVRP